MKEGVALALFTTFKTGGPARQFAVIRSEEEIRAAATRGRGSRVAVLGGGSNLLVPDVGVDGLVLKMEIRGIEAEKVGKDAVRVISGAGESWDAVVDYAAARGWWGIENLAGIPGTVGGAVVQNIGAYGADLADVLESARGIDLSNGESFNFTTEKIALGYRTSTFKQRRELVITHASLILSRNAEPNLSYKDISRAQDRGEPLSTPAQIARVVRHIRAGKFPNLQREGTAGSFFRNPVITSAQAYALGQKYPGLPEFPQANGVKIPLAWLLDHALELKGYGRGRARLFERQPLVIVAAPGASSKEIEHLAQEITERVFNLTGIKIEREVETFAAHAL